MPARDCVLEQITGCTCGHAALTAIPTLPEITWAAGGLAPGIDDASSFVLMGTQPRSHPPVSDAHTGFLLE